MSQWTSFLHELLKYVEPCYLFLKSLVYKFCNWMAFFLHELMQFVYWYCYFQNICIHKHYICMASFLHECNVSIQSMLQRFNKQLILNAKYFSCFFRWGKCQWSKHDVPLLLGFASFPLWRRTRSGLVTSQLHRHSDPELTILLGN